MTIMKPRVVGPTRFAPDGGDEVVFSFYQADGSISIRVHDNGEPLFVATTCLNGYGHTPPEGYVWLKGWSENEGVPAALAASGWVVLTGETMPAGRAAAQLARLTDKAHAEIERTWPASAWVERAKLLNSRKGA
jgi:hypothetical protein